MEPIKNDPHLALLSGYELEYYLLNIGHLIPRRWGPVKEKDRESVYKKAVEEGKTWEEVIGYKPRKGIIL